MDAEKSRSVRRISGRKFVPWFALLLTIATITFATFARSTEQVRREARARFMAAEQAHSNNAASTTRN